MCSEKRFDKLEEKVDRIMENHLPHIEAGLVQCKTELRIWGAIILLGLGALIRMVMLQ